MAIDVEYTDWGVLDYQEAWDKQEEIFNLQLKRKKEKQPTSNTLIFVEHPHVYTLGKSGDQTNLLIAENLLKQIKATYYKVNRGGDITYHGPGQIVGYPILDLEHFNMYYKEYIDRLEEVVIQYLKQEYGIESHRSDGATGVWLGEGAMSRKICAIGTKGSRYVTMHGFALNINTDLKYYDYINPCGFTDRGVTSVEKEIGKKLNIEEEKEKLVKYFEQVFEMNVAK
ncbi:lipoyl(octanoyl) transferase LipB [Puteibacter caeruleilacunae]|nr:lipoyl(octanoyl) transferase LipB [Puteibacter caeruleilacunae]